DANLDDLKLFSEKFDADALNLLAPEKSVERRKELSGTARRSVQRQLRQARAKLERTRKWLRSFPTISEQIQQRLVV
ncbi:MAG: argininosuccinate lyase, partial [Armatimonadota bacterium]